MTRVWTGYEVQIADGKYHVGTSLLRIQTLLPGLVGIFDYAFISGEIRNYLAGQGIEPELVEVNYELVELLLDDENLMMYKLQNPFELSSFRQLRNDYVR